MHAICYYGAVKTISMTFFARLPAFVTGLFIMGLGIGLVTIAGLGTSPISSPSYVLGLATPLSFGLWTLLFTLVFFGMELAVYGRASQASIWLQLPVAPALGLIIDLFMAVLPQPKAPRLWWSILMLCVGCLALALGIWMQIKANLVINPGEGIVKALAWRLGRAFGTVKLFFDSSLVLLALVFSLTLLKRIEGIGPGTLVSALVVGPLVRLLDRIWSRARRHPAPQAPGRQIGT